MMAKCVLTHGSPNPARRSSNAMSDRDLEDQLYQLKDQNTILKREAHNANYQVKCLNTKLTRLINEKKKLVRGGQSSREVEMEELIFNMNLKVDNLMRENERLNHTTLLLRTQMQPQQQQPSKRSTRPKSGFANVKPRVDTGLAKSSNVSRQKSVSMVNLVPTTRVTFAPTPPPPMHLQEIDDHQINQRGITVNNPNGQSAFSSDFALRLLKEAREEINSLEDVVANQQCFIESTQAAGQSSYQKKKLMKNGHEMIRDDNSDFEAPSLPIAIENSKGKTRTKSSVKCGQTQTDITTMVMSSPIENRKGHVSEMMSVYMGNLEQELKRAREEMSEIQDQLISAKMNTIKVDELNRKVKSLEKENAVLQECLSSRMDSFADHDDDKSLGVLKQSLKHCQIQISCLEQEKKLIEAELSSQREKVRNGMEENFELRSLLNQAKKQMEESQSIVRVNSVNQCNHQDLTQQLICMEQERSEFLNEFTQMKQMLELIHSSLEESQWDDKSQCS